MIPLLLALSALAATPSDDELLAIARPGISDEGVLKDGSIVVQKDVTELGDGRVILVFTTSTVDEEKRNGYFDNTLRVVLVELRKDKKGKWKNTHEEDIAMPSGVGGPKVEVALDGAILDVTTSRFSDGEGSSTHVELFDVGKSVTPITVVDWEPSTGSGYPHAREKATFRIGTGPHGRQEIVVEKEGSYCKDPEDECEEKSSVEHHCATEKGWEQRDHCLVKSSWSSSELKSAKGAYAPEMAIDGNVKTAWVEGDPGDGKGQSIQVNFHEVVKLKGIRIVPGYLKSNETWSQNNRVKKVRITLSDGTEKTETLNDSQEAQLIPISKGETESVKIEIVDVTRGSKFNDACISEIEFVL